MAAGNHLLSLASFNLGSDAALRIALNKGAFSSSSFSTLERENSNMLSLLVCLKQLGTFLEQRAVHSFCTSFVKTEIKAFFKPSKFQAAEAICLKLPFISDLPMGINSSDNMRVFTPEGQFTIILAATF